MLSALIRIASSRLDEAILMSTHNIQFHDKIRKNHEIFVFLNYWENFVGTEKRVRIIHGKRDNRVRAIVVILYLAQLDWSRAI